MILRDGNAAEIDGVLEQTAGIWAEGLDPGAYAEWVRTLLASAWATDGNFRFLVLEDDSGRIVSSMKLYRLAARLEGAPISVGGVGAVFTMPDQRGKGHAATMISQAHRIMSDRGDAFSLLYSDIGATYYARMGYREIDPHPVSVSVPAEGPAPQGVTRMHRSDVETIQRLRQMEDDGSALAILRDVTYWKHLLARWSFPTLHRGADRWDSRVLLAGRSGYLWWVFSSTGPDDHRARLMEFAEEKPGAALPALMDAFFEECRQRGVRECDAWMSPAQAARDPRLADLVTPMPSASSVPMWFSLDEQAAAAMKRGASASLLCLGDAF